MMARNAKATRIFMDPIISPAQARFGWRFWLLTLAALVAMAVTATLGAWQLSRAAQKQALQAMLVAREQMPVLVGRDLERARVGGVAALLQRNVQLRASVQHNWRDGGCVRKMTAVSTQLLYWF